MKMIPPPPGFSGNVFAGLEEWTDEAKRIYATDYRSWEKHYQRQQVEFRETWRWHFAGQYMANERTSSYEGEAAHAVEAADALIAELEREK